VVQVLDTIDVGDGHPVVASALLELADEQYEVTFDLRGPSGRSMRTARLDRVARSRLRRTVDREDVRVRDDSVVGTLVEADFERNTARLRGPFNELVTVSFADELADEIQDGLRRQSTFRGEISYDPETLAARSVRLRAVTRGRQLVLGIDPGEFWNERTFEELIIDQGGVVATEPDEIYDADASEEERDAFIAALTELGL
jgi:hypothetical protein